MNEPIRSTIGFFIVVFFSTVSADALEIRVKRESRCAGSLVRVQDVAEVLDTDVETAASVALISLFPTPSRVRIISSQELQRLLHLHGVDPAVCKFTGAKSTSISPAPVETTAELAGHAASFGNFTLQRSTRHSESADIPHGSTIVIARRPLQRGETIRSADVELQEATGSPPQNAFWQIDDVVGMETMRPFRAGQPIEASAVQPPVLVKRGETITVVALAAGVRVRTAAKALEDGRRGELILVQGADREQKYTARVADFQRAEVYAGGRRVTR